jgi:hypothetical protein
VLFLLDLILGQPPDLNERRFFFFFDRHGDVTSADRTLKLSPIAPSLKPSVYDRATLRALSIGIAIIVRFGFRNEFALRHDRIVVSL